MPAVAAVPAALRRYADRSAGHGARALSPTLGGSLDRLRGARAEGLGHVPALDHELEAWTRRRAELDAGLLTVADRLDAADRGTWAGVVTVTQRDAVRGLAVRLRRLRRARSAEALGRFAAGLTSQQRRTLAWGFPELVGPTDGLPATMRYQANAVLLRRSIDEYRTTVAELERAGLPSHLTDDVRGRLATLEALAEPAHDPVRCAFVPRQLLLFSAERDGRVVEVMGDLDTALHLTVFVPGITNTLDNYLDGTRGNTARLHTQADRAADGHGRTAAIAWLGYDTPGLYDAILPGRAEQAGPVLHRAVEALERPGGATVTVVGHSYGSLVTGHALRDGLQVDHVVLAGSPGMGVDHVDELGTGAEVYALRAVRDPVSLSEWHGADPADPRFGAIPLTTGDDRHGETVTGHSAYFDTGSDALRNIALVATGHGDAADRVDTGWLDRALAWADRHGGGEGPVEDLVEGIDTARDLGRDAVATARGWLDRPRSTDR